MNNPAGCPGERCAGCGRYGTILSTVHEVAFIVLKGLAAWSCASQALFADALHSTARMARRFVGRHFKNSRVISGSLLLLLAALILFCSLRRLFLFGRNTAVCPSLWALGVALLASVSGAIVARYIQCAADQLASVELKVLAFRNRSSAYVSMGVAAAILLAQFRLPEIDIFAAVLFGLIVGKMALKDLADPLARFWQDRQGLRSGSLLSHVR